MNLFRPVFAPESFDLVVCNGVLHHTGDPFRGLQSISELVKKGGHLVVGLYNTYGRIPTDIKRLVFKLCSNRFKFLDSRMRTKGLSDERKQAWFMDQYRHPYESKHTMGEVIGWFNRVGFEFVNSIPKATAFDSFDLDEQLFEVHPKETRLDHFIVQAGLLVGGGREGGFFVMIGRRNG